MAFSSSSSAAMQRRCLLGGLQPVISTTLFAVALVGATVVPPPDYAAANKAVDFLQLSSRVVRWKKAAAAVPKKASGIAQSQPTANVTRSHESALRNAHTLLRATKQKLAEQELGLRMELARRKENYTKILQKRDERIEATRAQTKKVQEDTEKLAAKIHDSRSLAKQLQSEMELLRNRIAGLHHNLTSAQEYMNETAEYLRVAQNSSDFDILREIERHEARMKAKAAKLKRVESVRQHGGKRISGLVQLSGTFPLAAESQAATASRLITGLDSGFEELSRVNAAQVRQLQDWYKREKQTRVEVMAEAQSAYDAALKGYQEFKEVSGQVNQAVEYLQAKKKLLEERELGLRHFFQRLGVKASPVDVVPRRRMLLLFQGGAKKGDEFSEMPATDLSISVSPTEAARSLEATFATQEVDSRVRMMRLREAFAQKLAQVDKETKALVLNNTRLTARLKEVEEDNELLRARAKTIEGDNAEIMENLKVLNTNLSSAVEFAETTLDNLFEPHPPELAVLDEFQANRAAMASRTAKLLQVLPREPAEILTSIRSSLQDLRSEQKQSEAELRQWFMSSYARAEELQRAHMQENRRLTTEYNEATKRHDELAQAVAFLEDTEVHLREQMQALRLITARIGARPRPAGSAMPLVHQGVPRVQALMQVRPGSVQDAEGDVAGRSPRKPVPHFVLTSTAMEKEMSKMLSQGQKSLDSLKKECTQRVHILRHNSERYAQGNSKVEAEIHQLDLQNSMRRTRTQSLLSQCKGLQDKVVNLTKEAATVDFGLADSIKIAEGKQAMHELENSMAHILNQLTPEPETDSVALMQVRPKALNRMSHAASDMARALEQHFQDVLETQTSFARTMFELEKDHEDLLAEQVSLHAKRDRLRTQGFHLVQLADRLDIIRQRLQDGVTALQKYQGSKKAGTNLMQNRRTKVTKTAINRNKRTNKHTAFVQLGHQARVVHKKDAGSFDAFESTSSRVSQLKQQLVEEELDHKQRMAMARRMLDQKLGEHERCVSDLEAQNTRIKKEIDELMQSSVQLRTSSSELEKDCALFREDVAALQHNLTTAQEYIKGTAEKANDILHDYDLSVLTELDDKDLQVAEANTRRNRAESIRSVRQEEGALLQVAAQPANKVDATMLLNVLHDDLNSLGESASSEEAALRSSYRVKFDDFHKRKKTLLTEQAQLNETKASMKKVNVMLQEAHNFLEKSRQSLEQRSRALRRFMQRLGIRPAPVGVSRRHALALAGAAANGHLNPGIYRGRHQEETIADNHKILDEETEDFDLTAGA